MADNSAFDINVPLDGFIKKQDVSQEFPMTNDPTKVVSETAAMEGDLAVFNATRRKAWVSGIEKDDTFVYYSKGVTVDGYVTFYVTDTGTASGAPVFKNVYADSITVTPYGTSALYQIGSPTISANKKSVTVQVNQVTNVLAGLLQSVTAANGVQVNLLVLGD